MYCFFPISGSKHARYSLDADPEDEDVITERNRVMSGETADDVLTLEGLTKVCSMARS